MTPKRRFLKNFSEIFKLEVFFHNSMHPMKPASRAKTLSPYRLQLFHSLLNLSAIAIARNRPKDVIARAKKAMLKGKAHAYAQQ